MNVEVTCWCERWIVLVPRRQWAMQPTTRSCGHPFCRNPNGVTVMAKVVLDDHLRPVTPRWQAA